MDIVDKLEVGEISQESARALLAAVIDNAKTFKMYVKIHNAKGTVEANKKALFNSVKFGRCKEAIKKATGRPIAEVLEMYNEQ